MPGHKSAPNLKGTPAGPPSQAVTVSFRVSPPVCAARPGSASRGGDLKLELKLDDSESSDRAPGSLETRSDFTGKLTSQVNLKTGGQE